MFQGGYRWVDGTYSATCSHYRAAGTSRVSARTNGIYWIKPGSKAFKVYCDMVTDGGGWTRFWWYTPNAGMTGVKDVLGQTLDQCAPTDKKCLSIMPVLNPTELMTTADNKAFQIYAFNGGRTSTRVKASLTTRNIHNSGAGDAWPPVRAVGTSVYRSSESGAQARYWWYRSQNGVKSFNLDNDSGWCFTFFTAGYDSQNRLGVDHTDNGCSSYNSTQKGLYLYFRVKVASGNNIVIHNGARRRADGSYEKSCKDYRQDFAYSGAIGSGEYWIQPDATKPAFKAFCEMNFQGGGWLAVYNQMKLASNNSGAAAMFSAITTRAAMTSAILPTSTSKAVHTTNIPLKDYTEVVYGWAASASAVVTRWGWYQKSGGLANECYLTKTCGNGSTIATFTIYPQKITRALQTGNSPTYPHVGIGWTGQQILWGYDRNNSSYGNWANWNSSSCCNSGNTSDARNASWRYVIYVR